VSNILPEVCDDKESKSQPTGRNCYLFYISSAIHVISLILFKKKEIQIAPKMAKRNKKQQ